MKDVGWAAVAVVEDVVRGVVVAAVGSDAVREVLATNNHGVVGQMLFPMGTLLCRQRDAA